jgi:membrane-associated protease RseP (regulator of RpoE activity)
MTDTDRSLAASPPGAMLESDRGRAHPWLLVPIVLGLVWIGMQGIWGLVMVLSILGAIVLHEAGHYFTARWTGMQVTQFFLGFGPKIWSFRRGETEFGIKAIPAGGYARITGMTNLEEVDPALEHRTYRVKSYPRRVLVASAGSIVHFLIAFVLLVVSFGFIGVRSDDNWSIGVVQSGSPAAAAGLESGDVIVGIDGVEVTAWSEAVTEIQSRPGETVSIGYVRDGVAGVATTTLASVTDDSGQAVGRLGVGAEFPDTPVSPLEVVPRAIGEMGSLLSLQAQALWDFVSGGLGTFFSDVFSDDPSDERPISIIGLVQIGDEVGQNDGQRALELIAVFNLFIGFFNMLPLLPLDGGHVAVATYERIRSRGGRRYRVDMAKLLPVTYAVFLFLVVLGAASFYLDIRSPILN